MPVGIFWREETFIAEHVYIISQMLTTDFGQHLIDYEIDIFIVPVLTAYGMRTEERRYDMPSEHSSLILRITRNIFSSSAVLRP